MSAGDEQGDAATRTEVSPSVHRRLGPLTRKGPTNDMEACNHRALRPTDYHAGSGPEQRQQGVRVLGVCFRDHR